MPPATKEHWSIDRKVPIAVVATFTIGLIVQAAGIVWWFAKLEARQTTVEQRVAAADVQASERFKVVNEDQDRLANILTALIERTTRLEADYFNSKADVSRRLGNIEDKLDRLLETLPQRRSDAAPTGDQVWPYQRKAAEGTGGTP
jgi:hypothetical protein